MSIVSEDLSPGHGKASADVLLLHASRFGQGVMVAQALAGHFHEVGLTSQLACVQDAPADVSAFRAVMVIASIRYGHFDPAVSRFVKRYAPQLERTVSTFVSINLTARKPDKRTPQTNAYTRKFLVRAAAQGWVPDFCEVLAGALRYPRYNWLDRNMIRFIMLLTGGETDTSREVEYTDWGQVSALAQRVVQRLSAKTGRIEK